NPGSFRLRGLPFHAREQAPAVSRTSAKAKFAQQISADCHPRRPTRLCGCRQQGLDTLAVVAVGVKMPASDVPRIIGACHQARPDVAYLRGGVVHANGYGQPLHILSQAGGDVAAICGCAYALALHELLLMAEEAGQEDMMRQSVRTGEARVQF